MLAANNPIWLHSASLWISNKMIELSTFINLCVLRMRLWSAVSFGALVYRAAPSLYNPILLPGRVLVRVLVWVLVQVQWRMGGRVTVSVCLRVLFSV